MTSDYEIGATLESLTAFSALTTPVPDPYCEYLQYVSVETMSDGLGVGNGLPSARMSFAYISIQEREQLRLYCPRASARVYVRLRTSENTNAFAVFSGILHWPYPEDRQNTLDLRFQFVLTFTDLELVDNEGYYLY